jgi:acetyl-CoA C-acetyltransferase
MAARKKYAKPVYLVDGTRTPFLKARGKPGHFKHADLGISAARSLLLRMPFEPTEFDEVIFGSTMPGPDEANIARIVALRLGCGDHVPAYTVHRNCASGMQALDNAAMSIASGRSNLVAGRLVGSKIDWSKVQSCGSIQSALAGTGDCAT